MKKSLLNAKGTKAALLALALLPLSSLTVSAQTLTPVFTENFNRASSPVSVGGTPAVTYSTTTTTTPETGQDGGTSRTRLHETSSTDFMFQLLSQHTGQTGNYSEVNAPISTYGAAFNPVLKDNTRIVSWRFTMKHNRSSTGGTAGFNGTQYGQAVVLAADNANFRTQSGSTAKGYAVVILKGATNAYEVSLIRFTDGLNNRTVIAGPSAGIAGHVNWVTVRVDYNPANNEWKLFFRDENSTTVKGNVNIDIPAVAEFGTGVDGEYTSTRMTHFGFATNTPNAGTPGAVGNALLIDDYTVGVAATVASLSKEADAKVRVSVYPNPSQGKLSIAADHTTKGIYTIYNLKGAAVATGDLQNASDISLAGSAKGLYLVKVTTTDWVHTQKVLLE